GRPKGVEIGHRALASFNRAAAAQAGLTGDDVVLATTTVGFDISVLELLTPLTLGARVHVVPREVAVDGQRLGEALDAAGVTVFQTTPSGLRLLLGSGWSGAPALKVLVGGEALPRDLALEARDRVAELHNVYGPTETTVWVTGRRVERAELEDGPDVVPIGGVFADTKLLVLDGRRRPVPPGGRGELYVAGPQVAQGYLHRPELDAERFVPDPTGSGARMYATGDVVRARTDGTLDFLGRADQQVKIRGFRVEPAEIETALRRQPGVRDAVVTTEARPDGLELVAFVVGVGPLVQDDLRSGLRQVLPGYMIPAAIHVVPHIPRSPSGKVDKKQLPKVSAPPPSAETPAVAPNDRVEAQLLELWRALLGRRDVGLYDNFFDVGGHSMLAARLAAKVEKHLGQRLPVATFFQAQTVAEQAEVIRRGGAHLEWTALDPVKASGARVPVFYIGASDQARMLARHLPADQPMYALLVLGLPAEHSLELDLVARTFVDEITTLQPEGPYAVAGYCQDAKLALAVAKELQARGAKVARLIYIDVVWIPDLEKHARSQLKRNLVDMGPGYGLHWFDVRARHHVKRRSELAWDRLMLARQARVGAEPPTTTVHRERLRALRANMARYPELSFEGDVDVILSQELHREGAARYLAHMAQGNLRVFEIPGVHQRMFDAPEVLWLASRLARCLEDTFSAADT
ncbi:MAG: AMP-binding protein, partial [Myxococcales bacterium]|nr:AMP-binding protein [Myxococcales bacterium]